MMDALTYFPADSHQRVGLHSYPAQPVDIVTDYVQDAPQPVIVFEQPGGLLQMGEQEAVTGVDGVELTPQGETPLPINISAGITKAHAQTINGGGAELGKTGMQSSDGAVGGTGLRTETVAYVVGVHDTFAAIAMRHKMTEDEMMRLNSLRRRHVRPGDIVLVYAQRSDEESRDELRRQMVRRFRREWRCPVGEALYYLEGASYEFDAATADRRRDVDWEHELETERADEPSLCWAEGGMGGCVGRRAGWWICATSSWCFAGARGKTSAGGGRAA